MVLFADILLAALAITAPKNGATVPTLRETQRAYLAAPRAEREKTMEDAASRQRLVAGGAVQPVLTLAWSGPTNAVAALTIAPVGGARQTFAVTNRNTAWFTNLETGRAYEWQVTVAGETAKGTFRTAADSPRLLYAPGVGNFRDLGGWKGMDGRRVRQNRLFRSAGLRNSARKNENAGLMGATFADGGNRIAPQGIAILRGDFAVKTDIELRSKQEAATMSASVLGSDVRWVHEPYVAYGFIDDFRRGREPFARLFRTLLDEKAYPAIFHCSGGRDRTGTLAFLLNALLGVSDEDLLRDWEATVFFEENVNFSSGRLKPMLDYLDSLGGATYAARVENYVKACGITDAEIAKFRGLMLEANH